MSKRFKKIIARIIVGLLAAGAIIGILIFIFNVFVPWALSSVVSIVGTGLVIFIFAMALNS